MSPENINTATIDLDEPQAKPSIGILLFKTLQVVLVAVLTLFLWPLYWLGVRIWSRPPNVPYIAQVRRYLRLTWTVQPPAPCLSRRARVWLTLGIIRQWLVTPANGLAWLLDELLYGRDLNKEEVIAPLFAISGGRSGSTQITRYIEADPAVTAPNMLQCTFPYLWLWRLAPRTIGRLLPPEKARARIAAMMPAELLERHEFDPFKADTFDGALLAAHLNPFALYLGPEVSAQEFNFASLAPQDRDRLTRDFVRLVDRIGRKQQLLIGDKGTDTPRRFFLKGHFLFAADALERRYPDAAFLTLVRDPAERLQSGINYLRVNPSDPAVGAPPWAWLAASLLQTESEYCRVEQAWYSQEGVRRCVVRFADFVGDLEGTMQQVYRVCFDREDVPPHVPRTHPPRERTHYTVNRSLADLGIDAEALRAQLADYVAWCQPEVQQESETQQEVVS